MPAVMSFFGSAAKRDELIADVRANGALTRIWLRGSSGQARYDVVAQEYLLDPALVRLIAALAQGSGSEAADFVTIVLEGLPLDRTSAGIVQAWMIDRWHHALASRLAGSVAEAPARTIIDLVGRSRAGAVDPAAWRSAQRALIFAGDLPPGVDGYAEVMQAMAWDPSQTPGVAGDVVRGWRDTVRRDAFQECAWSDEKEQAYVDALVRHQTAAAGALADHDRSDVDAFRQAFLTKVAELFAAVGQHSLAEEGRAAHEVARQKVSIWEKEERRIFRQHLGDYASLP